ncbi:hypothetical protein TI03_00200 [Achromatium sp. WMS1]|nr:hypothetical protein TI03_00200 [Achromatium sp. WMS1]
MSYQVLARKWRPRNFTEFVGQMHIIPALSNALTRNQLHHAYLFTGTRGVGKTTLARILAKCLNCEQTPNSTPNPCGTCSACQEIDEGRFVDLLEIDAASRTKVDQTRELLDNVPYAPVRGRYKIYLIDEIHMFSTSSFNALLKTLEEPPPHVKFLLATTDPQKLPLTILSRCLQFNLKHLTPIQIKEQLIKILLAENITYETEALWLLSQAATGSMRDALSLLDQAIAFGGNQVTTTHVQAMLGTIDSKMILDLGEALANGLPAQVLQVVANMAEHMPDFARVLADILALLHELAIGQIVPESLQQDDIDPRKSVLARKMTAEDIQLFYQIGILGQRDLELAPSSRMGLEMVLLRMLAFRPADTLEQTIAQSQQPITPSTSNKQPTRQVSSKLPIQQLSIQQQVSTQQPFTQQQAPAQQQPIVQQTAPQPLTTPQVTPPITFQLTNNEDWYNLIDHLKLTGLANELAINCQFQTWDGHTLHLNLDDKLASLKNAEQNMANALRHHLGIDMRLDLKVTRNTTETPAQRSALKQQQWQQDQQNIFMNDKFVLALQQTFQAEIMPNSIRSIDTYENHD